MAVAGWMVKSVLLPVQAIDNLLGWPFTEPDSRWFRSLNGRGRKLLARVAFRMLESFNRTSRSAVLGDGPPVSLTTFGRRIPTAFASIESIGLGKVRPSRLVLWLDSAADLEQLDPRLQRLVGRGLEIRLSANYGPHTKYYPYVCDHLAADTALATADDDIIYPPNWLSLLQAAHRRAPNMVHCHRAHLITFRGSELASYTDWESPKTDVAGARIFATGVSGVIYPAKLLQLLRDRGDEFTKKCPRADDVWLHYMAVENSIGVRQIRPRGRHYPVVVRSQVEKLQNENVAAQGNDRQILATYPGPIIEKIAGAE